MELSGTVELSETNEKNEIIVADTEITSIYTTEITSNTDATPPTTTTTNDIVLQ